MRPRRQYLGQHFLHDRGIVRKIIEIAGIKENEKVVEIGPGPGILTKVLAGLPVKTTAIEVDKRLFDKLQMELNALGAPSPVKLIHADALEFPFDTLPSPFLVIGNLPYSIATPLLFHLLKYRRLIDRMILMVQREVAKRMVARPGEKDYGPLSIGIQFFTEPRIELAVSPGCFTPPPRVNSSVVCLKIRGKPKIFVKDEMFFLSLVRKAFTHRRKTLRNSLKEAGFPRDHIEEALIHTSLLKNNPGRRGETLSIDEWGSLADKLFDFSTES